MATQVDPVCGMKVDEQAAAGRSEHEGKAYYFCSQVCQTRFEEDPEKYAGESGEKQTEGRGRLL